MKLTKLSVALIAAAGMCTTASAAIENIKYSGQAKLIYQTADWELTAAESAANMESGIFNRGDFLGAGVSYGGSAGGASLMLGVTADVANVVSFGVEMQGVSTLGLENNLVNNSMWGGSLSAWNTTQAYLAKTMGKTTVKVGRQELDTPLAFTEKWNIAKNTFDAAVIVNTDIPKTTLVAAWVGKHNGDGAGRTAMLDNGVDEGSSPFATFGSDGAYAFGAVTTAIPMTTAQYWYYDVVNVATAHWLQGDVKIKDMVDVGLQYAMLDPAAAGAQEASIYAIKVAGHFKVSENIGLNVYGAYSSADEDGFRNFSNVSTGDKTKIYTGTASVYMDGIVTSPGADTWKVGLSTELAGVKLRTSYASATDVAGNNNDISAWDIVASGKVQGLGLTAIFTQVSNDSTMYAGRDNDTLRIVASLPF